MKKFFANRTVGWVAVGGSLRVEERTLRFRPNPAEKIFGRKEWVVNATDIASVAPHPPRYAPTELFTGGLRTRLAITTHNGNQELFVVHGLDKLITAFEAWLAHDAAEFTL